MLWLASAYDEGYEAGGIFLALVVLAGILWGFWRIRQGRPGAGLIGFSLLAGVYLTISAVEG